MFNLNGARAWAKHWEICAARPCPGEPTLAQPGSAEKLAVLEARWAAGLALWHPGDVRIRVPTFLRADGCYGREYRTKVARKAAMQVGGDGRG